MTNPNKTRRVVLAADWTTEDGKEHKGGDVVTLPRAEARNLVYRGKGRFAEDVELDKKKAPAEKPAEGKTEEKK